MNRRKSLTIAVNALLLTLTTIFCVVPIQIGPIRLAVLMLMPVLVAGQTQKWGTALFSGLYLGLLSMITSYITPGLLGPAFQNPMVSVFPRIFIGIVVYFSYHLIKKVFRNEKVGESFALTISSILGIMTNTGSVSLMLWAFYGKSGIGDVMIDAAFMQSVILVNFLIELAVCTLVSPPVSLAVKKTIERAGGR